MMPLRNERQERVPKTPKLTFSRADELLSYDPESGEFRWKKKASQKRAGDLAGSQSGAYTQIGIDGVIYFAHRVAVLLMQGRWPAVEVDHINGNRHDNRWSNLREANRHENNQNLGMRSDNASGVKGVWWDKTKMKWISQIQSKGKRYSVGSFETLNEAADAYAKAKANIHKFQPTVRDGRNEAFAAKRGLTVSDEFRDFDASVRKQELVTAAKTEKTNEFTV